MDVRAALLTLATVAPPYRSPALAAGILNSAREYVRAVSWARAEVERVPVIGSSCGASRGLDARLSGIDTGDTRSHQGDDSDGDALGLVLERWWRSTLVATALVWPSQPDGS